MVKPSDMRDRVGAIDWPRVSKDLNDHGNAVIESVLTASDCTAIADWYSDDALFRSRVVMASHGFGRGEYRYFAYPLPELVARMRSAFYPRLAPIANRWNESLRITMR